MGKHLRSCGKLVKSPISGAILMDVMSICSVILRISEAEDVGTCTIASRLGSTDADCTNSGRVMMICF